ENQPTILYGLKGVAGLELTVKGPAQDLHSGLYGGAVRNPIMALSHILTSMKNEEEVVTIDGFYDNVDDLTAEERALIEKVDRKSTRLNSSHVSISYAVFCLKKKKKQRRQRYI